MGIKEIEKIEVCQMCFEDSDLKENEVKIISEDECIEKHNKELNDEDKKESCDKCNKKCKKEINIEGTQECIHHNDGGITIKEINKNEK